MNIGEASAQSRVTTKMIRYYESVGLLTPAARRENGYRDYGDGDVAVLQFIRRARDLGFSLEETGDLLALWRDKRPSREVKRLAQLHIRNLEQRIEEMQGMADTLRVLANACRGDDRPDCPILVDFAAPRGGAKSGKPALKKKIGALAQQ
jgi:Cu(I)-responsive transcriptional regulator